MHRRGRLVAWGGRPGVDLQLGSQGDRLGVMLSVVHGALVREFAALEPGVRKIAQALAEAPTSREVIIATTARYRDRAAAIARVEGLVD
jgi:hypothetical protein